MKTFTKTDMIYNSFLVEACYKYSIKPYSKITYNKYVSVVEGAKNDYYFIKAEFGPDKQIEKLEQTLERYNELLKDL